VDRTLRVATSYSLAFSADSQTLATLGRDAAIWNLRSRKKVVRAHPFAHPSSACFSPSGDQLAVKSTSGEIALISTQDGTVIRNFGNSADGEGSNIQFSARGEFVIDGSWSGRVTVRHARSGNVEFSAEFPGDMITRVHSDASGATWVLEHHPKATSHTAPPAPCYFSVWRWPFARGTLTHFAARVPFASDSALAPDTTRLAVVHGAPPREISVFDMVSGTRSASCTVTCGGTGTALAWAPRADLLGSVQDGKAVIYCAETLKPYRDYALSYASDIGFSPDGRLVAIGSWKCGVVLPLRSEVTPNPALHRTRTSGAGR